MVHRPLYTSEIGKYELDVGRTMIGNVPGILFIILNFIALFLTLSVIAPLPQPLNLIGLIVYCFSMVKIMGWAIQSITWQYKPRIVRFEDPDLEDED